MGYAVRYVTSLYMRRAGMMFLRAVSSPDSQSRSADFEQARVALITPPRPAALLGSATQLFVADHSQNCPQLLVVSDRALVDLANLVEGAVGELDAVMEDRKSAVGVVKDGDPLADRRLGRLARLDDENHFVVLQCQRLREAALLLPGINSEQCEPETGRSGCTNSNTTGTGCTPGWTGARSGC